MPVTNTEFVIKTVFVRILQETPGEECHGKTMEHSGVRWRLTACWTTPPLFLNIYLECLPSISRDNWSLETTVNSTPVTFARSSPRHQLDSIDIGKIQSVPINNNLSVQANVTVGKIKRSDFNQRSFNESTKKFSDVVLVVNHRKFYVSKLFLASQSRYFENLFLGKFGESKRSEVELENIDPNEFQNFLELIHGESTVDEHNVVELLKLADSFESKYAMKKCEEFLLKTGKNSLKSKLELGIICQMSALTKKSISEMRTAEEIRSIVPPDPDQLSGDVWKELLLKSLSIKK